MSRLLLGLPADLVYVGVGHNTNGGPYGYPAFDDNDQPTGTISKSSVMGKAIVVISSGLSSGNGFYVAIRHGGTALSQSFFKRVTIQKQDGSLVTFHTNAADTFQSDVNIDNAGNVSQWIWTVGPHNIAVWGDAAGLARLVTFYK